MMQNMVSVNKLNRKLTRNRFRLLFTDFIIQVITHPSQANWKDVDCFGCTCHANEAVQASERLNSSPGQTVHRTLRGHGAPEPESERVRLFINLMRDSISEITVMSPIVSFMRSLRHVLNSFQTRQCAVVPELLSMRHSTRLMPSARITTQQEYQLPASAAHTTKDSFKIRQITKLHLYPGHYNAASK